LLRIPNGTPVIQLIRLRLNGEEPLVFSKNVILRECLPGPIRFRDWKSSLTDALEANGHFLDSSAARISATNLPTEYADRFGLDHLDPWLLIEETCITREGARVVYSMDYHRPGEIGFNVLRRRRLP
jgi:GntR family transcriptional regulator